MKKLISLSFLLLFLLIKTDSAFAVQYYTVPQVLKYLFPDADSVNPETKTLTTEQIQTLSQKLKTKDIHSQWQIYTAKKSGKIFGYAIVDEVKGKELPITYVVSITPQGSVKEVEILVYRESHGGEVKNKGYRKQFVGKTQADPIAVGRDIQNVSGATISSRNVAFGVKRALAVWNLLYNSF